MHARVVLGVGKGVLFREVSSVQECPHREREKFHCIVYYRYVQEDLLKPGDTHYKQFHKIFEAFKISEGSEATPKTTPTSPIPDDDTMSIAAKSSAAQKKQRDEESEDVSGCGLLSNCGCDYHQVEVRPYGHKYTKNSVSFLLDT